MTQCDTGLTSNRALQNLFKLWLGDIDQGPWGDGAHCIVLAFIGNPADGRCAEGFHHPHMGSIGLAGRLGVDLIHRQPSRRTDLKRPRIEGVGLG